jgi:hypothetical protein
MMTNEYLDQIKPVADKANNREKEALGVWRGDDESQNQCLLPFLNHLPTFWVKDKFSAGRLKSPIPAMTKA